MELATIVDQEAIYIGYDAANEWLYIDWKGEHTQESSREACVLILASLRARPCAKVLNDNSSISRIKVALTAWGTWWLEELQRAGLQYIAWVHPPAFASRQQTEAIVQRVERPIVATFDEVASAYVWLQQQVPAGQRRVGSCAWPAPASMSRSY